MDDIRLDCGLVTSSSGLRAGSKWPVRFPLSQLEWSGVLSRNARADFQDKVARDEMTKLHGADGWPHPLAPQKYR